MQIKEFVDQFISQAREASNGILAITVVDFETGSSLGNYSEGSLDPEVASQYNLDVVRAKLKAVDALGLEDQIDDILITLTTQYHLISCTTNNSHMIYLAADKSKSNLAMLRSILSKAKRGLQTAL